MPEIMGYEWVFDVYDADVSYGNTLAVRFLRSLNMLQRHLLLSIATRFDVGMI